VLLNSTKVNQAEKDASNNFSLGNFFVIDEVKDQLEKECAGVVSCADILALVAVYSIKAVRINFSGEFAAIKSLWVLMRSLTVPIAPLPPVFSNMCVIKFAASNR
jgi:hypothetical protein